MCSLLLDLPLKPINWFSDLCIMYFVLYFVGICNETMIILYNVCAVPWGDVQYCGGYHAACRGYHEYHGGNRLLFEYPHSTEHPPQYS